MASIGREVSISPVVVRNYDVFLVDSPLRNHSALPLYALYPLRSYC